MSNVYTKKQNTTYKNYKASDVKVIKKATGNDVMTSSEEMENLEELKKLEALDKEDKKNENNSEDY